MTPTNRKKIVVAHSVRPDAPLHEVETNRALARWLAHVLGLKYGGSYNPELHSGRDLYLLPTQTLVGAAQARQLGVKGPEDLWGGYVDHDFICTKAVSHGLLNKNAVAPEGWSPLFSERIRNVVLDGLSVHMDTHKVPCSTGWSQFRKRKKRCSKSGLPAGLPCKPHTSVHLGWPLSGAWSTACWGQPPPPKPQDLCFFHAQSSLSSSHQPLRAVDPLRPQHPLEEGPN